jgi:hypothetical protein
MGRGPGWAQGGGGERLAGTSALSLLSFSHSQRAIFAPRRLLLCVYLALPAYLIPSAQSLSLNVTALYARVEAVKGSFLFCSALFLCVSARICKCALEYGGNSMFYS